MAAAAAMVGSGALAAGRPLPDVGRKFAAGGRVLPFAENIIVCHLPQEGEHSEAFDAMLDVYRQLPREGWAQKVAALPPSCCHMIIFGGANNKERRHPLWPAGLLLDLPMAECDHALGGSQGGLVRKGLVKPRRLYERNRRLPRRSWTPSWLRR